MNGLFKQRLFYVIAAMVLVTPWCAFSYKGEADQKLFQCFQRILKLTHDEEEDKLKIERQLVWLTAQEKAGTIPSDRVIELKKELLDKWSENAVKFAIQDCLKTDRVIELKKRSLKWSEKAMEFAVQDCLKTDSKAQWAELRELPLVVQAGINMVISNLMPNLALIKKQLVINAWQLDQKSNDTNYNATKATMAKLAMDGALRFLREDWKRGSGREKTLVALDTIEEQTGILLKAGIDTNIFTGTIEQIDQKLSTTQRPELAEAVTALRKAIIAYGSAQSDVFSDALAESKVYQVIYPFPKVGSTPEADLEMIRGTISGIRQFTTVMQGFFYARYLGRDGPIFIANRKFRLPHLITDPIEFIIKKLLEEGWTRPQIEAELLEFAELLKFYGERRYGDNLEQDKRHLDRLFSLYQ